MTATKKRHGLIGAVLFDLGDTLIHERNDSERRLDAMTLHLMPHARRTLEILARDYHLGLVTDTESSGELAVRNALRKLGIESYFEAIVTSTDQGIRKPDPRMFLTALRILHVPPKEAAMVGNDSRCDIGGAKRLGMLTILFQPAGSRHPQRRIAADYCVSSHSQIPELLAAFNMHHQSKRSVTP